MQGFARIACAVPVVGPADVSGNVERTLELWRRADAEGCHVVVFPELGLSAYSARDLLHSRALLDACRAGLLRLAREGAGLRPLALVGLPLHAGPGVYNVAAALAGGRVLGLVPKAYLPTYGEFEEARWFRPGLEVAPGATVDLGPDGGRAPFGTDLVFEASDVPDLAVGVEVCEDLWVHQPPHAWLASAGATVVCNLSASNFIVGKAELRRLLCGAASDRAKCAYAYVAAGPGESSTDLAFDADAFVFENGHALAESRRFAREGQLVVCDVDLELLVHERRRTNTFGDCAAAVLARGPAPRRVAFTAGGWPAAPLRREVPAHPFLPRDPATLARRCWEIFEIQTNALVTRLSATRSDRLVLGVSGGLDSTHAALVAAGALDLMGLPRERLLAVTMPGLGTTAGTRSSAEELARALGASFDTIGVSELSRAVLATTGHAAAEGAATVDDLLARLRADPKLGDVSLENVQARLRTLVLMTLSNQHRALVVGTGDLSEKALGWSTYTGDHISHYDVNAGVPKTLIQFVIRWVANERAPTWAAGDPKALRDVLFRILDTPISPELLPADAEGQIAQLTESAIGPYELHDFFAYHTVRFGARPGRVLDLATAAFGGRYDAATLKRWLRVFVTRFFQHQFKRSCTADAPKVGNVALSPRGDWRMPSDARPADWLAAIEAWPA